MSVEGWLLIIGNDCNNYRNCESQNLPLIYVDENTCDVRKDALRIRTFDANIVDSA